MARANSGMGSGKTQGHPGESRAQGTDTDESTLASEIQGKNKLQGDDQRNVRNERRSVPDEKRPPAAPGLRPKR